MSTADETREDEPQEAPPSHDTLDEALLAAQIELGEMDLKRRGEGKVEGLNKAGKRFSYDYKYAAYPELLALVRPVLARHGLSWSSAPTTHEGVPALRYRLTHAPSREFREDVMKLMLDKQTSQAQGSGLTYARRQALQAVLEIAPDDDDDDGARASQPDRPVPVDPEAVLPENVRNAMLEALAERNLAVGSVLERLEIARPVDELTQEDGKRVKEALDAFDARRAAASGTAD